MKATYIQWLLGVLLALGCSATGYLLGQRDSAPDPDDPADVNLMGEGAPLEGAGSSAELPDGGAVPTPPAHDPTVSPETAAGIMARIKDVLAIDSYAVRRYNNEVVFDAMTAEQAPEVFAALRELPLGTKEDQLVMFFFIRWGQVDGAAAVAAALSLNDRRRGPHAAMALSGWSGSDPDKAWETARKLADGWPMFASRLGGVVTEMAKRDLPAAIAARNDVSDLQAARAVQNAVINLAIEEGKVDVVLDEIRRIESVEDQKQWLSGLFARWGGLDEDAPLAALKNISDPVLAESAMTGFLHGWTNSDPEGAMDYMLDNRDDPAAARALPNALRQVAYLGDRESALTLVEKLAGTDDADALMQPVVSSLASTHPDIALKLAETAADETNRVNFTSISYLVWARSDFESAVAHFEQMPQGRAKIRAISGLGFTALAREDGGQRISRWVNDIPAGTDRTQAIESLVNTAASNNIRPSTGSVATLRELFAETTGLSEQARTNAARLFGDGAGEGGRP